MNYVVKDVVCDYGVYETYFDSNGLYHQDLKLICNSRSNAFFIAEIMKYDLNGKDFDCEYCYKPL